MALVENTAQVMDVFRSVGGLLEGHFILTSGRHSRQFLQKAFVFMDPGATEALCKGLAAKIEAAFGKIDFVVAPAVGAVIPGYETARHLGAKSIYVEREDGAFRLRRGFTLPKGARVVVVEDIITTGLSVRETLDAIRASENNFGADIVGAAVLVDRSGGKADVGAPLVHLAQVDIETFDPNDLPDDLKDVPAIKPGSRALSQKVA